MPDKIDLPDGGWAEIRTALTGGDEKWFYAERGKLIRANGTGKPARSEPDPDNTAVMKEYPAEPAYLTEDDTFTLFDMLIRRLVASWSLPYPPGSWSAEIRDAADLDLTQALDEGVGRQMQRLQGMGPKPVRSGGTSAGTSAAGATAPLTVPTPEPSSTASA